MLICLIKYFKLIILEKSNVHLFEGKNLDLLDKLEINRTLQVPKITCYNDETYLNPTPFVKRIQNTIF